MQKILTQLGATTVKKVGGSTDLETDVKTIISGVIGVLGLVAVVVMVIGGVQYMTSAGDASKVEKGKKTILYGLIGLIIAALAFAIVNFTIDNILKADNDPSAYTSEQSCKDAGFKWSGGSCKKK